MQAVGFFLTFLVAWFTLDRLAVSPPMPLPALVAFGAAVAVLAIGQRIVYGTRTADMIRVLGLGRPVGRALIVATITGTAIVAGFVLGASALGITLQLRPEWPLVLIGALVFHGLAEETVWRGYVYGHLRQSRTFRRAVLLSMPLIALTHVPIIVSNGLLVGSLAFLAAAITCLPLAYLYERGGRTIWAPALVHGMIGTWQIFDRTYPITFSIVVMLVTIVVPFIVFLFRDRYFGAALDDPAAAAAAPARTGVPVTMTFA